MWQLQDYPMWSLGIFRPDARSTYLRANENPYTVEHRVGVQFERWLKSRLNSFTTTHVRSPWHQWALAAPPSVLNDGDNVKIWHQDGTDVQQSHLGVWSNTHTTEILDPISGDIYHGAPYEVILFDNVALQHRTPTMADRRARWVQERWFGRFDVPSTCEVSDVEGVYAMPFYE